MRKIQAEILGRIYDGKPFAAGNTALVRDSNGDSILSLHGNPIAKFKAGCHTPYAVSWAGWVTHTTQSRLNILPGVVACVRNFTPYINGKPVGESGWFDLNGKEVCA